MADLGLLANARKREDRFVQLFLMAGVLMMSLRSLGQKHRLHDLADDLRRERDDLSLCMCGLQDALCCEADADTSGALAYHLRRIFAAHPAPAPPRPRTSRPLARAPPSCSVVMPLSAHP
ncbi:hypothetical protein PVAP13_5KG699050 [Panicum virgatum]|uniref:Uncharacterized protein n=1 Tax=Panicum virgatum TaxID=38727 RepID=A0A8T0T2Q1_PANVG|nr:hypothetical protein PVAP13_5KG699050 [Panicum virgatum]